MSEGADMKHETPMNKQRKRGRHEAGCRVCAHPERQQIETEWCSWGNASKLAKKYGLSRDSIYRHCRTLQLFEKRSRNLKGALERIIEQADSVAVNASAVVAAVQAYSKITSQGSWVDRVERINLNSLFEKMSVEELEQYAKTGDLPGWFRETLGATPIDGQEDSQNTELE
jgi:hypothetical protein